MKGQVDGCCKHCKRPGDLRFVGYYAACSDNSSLDVVGPNAPKRR